MRLQIKIHESKDIMKINKIVSGYAYEIWLQSSSGIVDAKSVLGLMALGMGEKMYLVVEDNIDTSGLEKEMEEFLVKE